ncbi:hypothetical protein DPMN_135891 [Dreissena polymorpha]|uniref:Uncharacterized protein n=1 Tax=Dreissena polymorpha TaxID=45954 RepID=A0A9D4JC48_DREPO|nr:hypothetical protein DPMN_135891 [Dreissena polymorpha]
MCSRPMHPTTEPSQSKARRWGMLKASPFSTVFWTTMEERMQTSEPASVKHEQPPITTINKIQVFINIRIKKILKIHWTDQIDNERPIHSSHTWSNFVAVLINDLITSMDEIYDRLH